jgi:hypothetical protein
MALRQISWKILKRPSRNKGRNCWHHIVLLLISMPPQFLSSCVLQNRRSILPLYKRPRGRREGGWYPQNLWDGLNLARLNLSYAYYLAVPLWPDVDMHHRRFVMPSNAPLSLLTNF